MCQELSKAAKLVSTKAPCYNPAAMRMNHAKHVRRRLLLFLYDRYMANPLDLSAPADFLDEGIADRETLIPNIHYLGDRGLVELMEAYAPPLFAAARITADGIDLVENPYEFNLRFPAALKDLDESLAGVPTLIERLLQEAEFSPLDGEARQCLLRDVQYLRDEVARPVERWRGNVVGPVLEWIEAPFGKEVAEVLPSLVALRKALEQAKP